MDNSNTIRPTELVPTQQLALPLIQQLAQPLVQQQLRPLVQPQTIGFYVYQEPSLGWVVVPVGPGIGMPASVCMLEGMTLAPTALPSAGTRNGERSSQYQRTKQEVVESKGKGSEQQQESSDAGSQEEEVERTLFVTFSRGFPVEPTVLQDYFTNEYGDIVEAVILQRVKAEGEHPLYARVLLKSAVFVNLVLRGHEKLRLKLDGRDAWMRPYARRTSTCKNSRRQQHRHLHLGRRGGLCHP